MYKYALIAFTVIAVSALISSPKIETALHFFTVVVAAIVFDLTLHYIKNKKLIVPYSAYITGLIVAMLLDTSTEIIVLLFVILVAIFSKHLIKWKGKHIFNPATFGMVFAGLFFTLTISWYGATSWPLILVTGLLLLYKIKQLTVGLSFYIFFGVLLTFNSIVSGVNIVSTLNGLLLAGPLLFFSFFMVTEPKTSPFTIKGQVLFGLLAATFSFASQYFMPEFFPLIGLLAANVFTQTINGLTLKK